MCVFDIVTLAGEYEVILYIDNVEATYVGIYIMYGEIFYNRISHCDIFLYRTLFLFKNVIVLLLVWFCLGCKICHDFLISCP